LSGSHRWHPSSFGGPGSKPGISAIDGTQEVWGAMLGSTLSNIVVFVPLIMVTGEAGQLYADMAIALSASSLFSLFAALTLVPMLSGLFLKQSEAMQMMEGGEYRGGNWFERLVAKTSTVFRHFQGKFENFLTSTVRAIRQSEQVQKYLRSQSEVERILYVDRPGALRGIATILKPEFATTTGLAEMVDRLRAQSSNFAGYRFIIPSRISIFRDPGKEFEIDIVGAELNQISDL